MFVYQVFMLFLLIVYRLYIFIETITSVQRQCHKTHRTQTLVDEYNISDISLIICRIISCLAHVGEFIDLLWRMTYSFIV